MLTIYILATFAVALSTIVCIYHFVLAVVGLLFPSRMSYLSGSANNSFAIVIPAHNEEFGLAATLASCAAIEYPRDKYQVFVVADNCDDATESVAQQAGIHCMVRKDRTNRGKGHALAWALPQVLEQGFDGILVLDADCFIDRHVLQVADSHFTAGNLVLQANNSVINPDESPTSYLLAVANLLENDFFDAPKSFLGLASRLRGTGMILHGSVLTDMPWQACSVVEDSEYTSQLLRRGIPVRFLASVRVVSKLPTQRQQLVVQRSRWIAGIHSALPKGLSLFWEGIRDRRLVLADAGFSTLVAGRFLVIYELLAAFVLALLCWLLDPSHWSLSLVAITIATAAFYFLYVLIGVIKLGVNRKRMSLLAHAPLVIVQYLNMAFFAIVSARTAQWQRTPRA